MREFYYDLHLHSCLSPCGDEEMTPANIAGMAFLKQLDIVALTDHNTCGNCRAFFAACHSYGIVPVAGMELTTSEDVHLVCLFDTLEGAERFDQEVSTHRVRIKNRPEVFGTQKLVDENDNIIGFEEYLLPNATDLSVDDAYLLVNRFGGAVYPAHIDREGNGIIAMLGIVPDQPDFSAVEYKDKTKKQELCARYSNLPAKKTVTSSDAHYLWDINERENFLTLDVDPDSNDQQIRESLIRYLK